MPIFTKILNLEKRVFKDRAYFLWSQLVKAMANPHRLEIIDLLGQAERSVEDIATESNLSVANASQHLQQLKKAGLVSIRKEGNYIYYGLASNEVGKSMTVLKALAMDNFSEINQLIKDFRKKKNSLESVTISELIKRMKAGEVILLDVREENEFKAGHIPNALNIPVGKLLGQLKSMDRSMQYIAYCRGPFCVFADEAVQLLRKHHFKAFRLEEGFPDWKTKGLPVEVAA
ncbi:metalloregulator ArsR/SmtB family transcription factor [Arachidicoccus ginsenosidivorans]|jgi:rhodanese-related sulfurtransferase/predicted transcriptional regulator|uniref:Metalloregulator ArsR/SmtB family transcription factor n=1 Tax=Arachidicoccus ginsenosidivorans TaxID=496057 RepID=A0A5B8VNV6_9BACT|nr:metalloregulator ArsR/SmtB family transcription factor [Arachidicoccus ginsenosidivorans]